MLAHRYVITALFAALAFQTSVRAQQCDSGSGRIPIHLDWPYTAEFHLHEHNPEKPKPERDYFRFDANDSQGRTLVRFTEADGQSSSQVFDPVAAEQTWWASYSTSAKLVKYPTPFADRSSCWRRQWSERSTTGHSLGFDLKTSCAPAGLPPGQGQYPNCRDVCYADRLAKAVSPEKKGFPKCVAAPGGTAEDLGMSAIQGIEIHGCRNEWEAPNAGKVVQEIWSDEYGLPLRQIDEHANGYKSSEELIRLSRDEPDVSNFQPPRGRESVTLEMDEVPCEQVKPLVVEYMK